MDESSAAKESQAEVETDAVKPTLSMIASRYRVLRVLGEGSTGTVYLCEHTALEKEVAVKILHRDLADNPGLVARFTREAQTAARLDHPSSVHVMDFGQDRDGTLFLVMEYVEGRDLAQLLDDKVQLDDERIVHVMSCILSALSAAHALGIVHRDLKPENVLIRSSDPGSSELDVVKVCDFGVAQFSPVRMAHNNNHARKTEARRVTGDGMLVGTPWYMSPEQARAETLDARSDIYSAGVVLFQLLTRTLPFMGDDVMAVALMHCTTPPPPPSGFGAVHPGLESVCLRALSKTREARYQSANEMLTELRAAVLTKVASRSLARISKTPSVPGAKLALSPLSAAYPSSGSSTPMGTPTVRHPSTISRRKLLPSLLVAAVATVALGVVALPRSTGTRAGSQPTAASARIQDEPGRPSMAAMPSAPAQLVAAEPMPALQMAPAPSVATQLTGNSGVPSQALPLPPSAAVPRPHRPRSHAASAATSEPKIEDTHASDPPPSEAEARSAAEGVTSAANASSSESAPAATAESVTKPATAAVAEPAAAATATPESSAPATHVEPVATSEKPAVVKSEVPARAQPLPAAASAAPAAKIAHVQVSADHLPPGTSRASLYSALSQGSLLNCYTLAQQRAPQAPLPGSALELKTNTSGRIVWAHVANTALPAPLRECLEQVARSGHVRTGEGGEVQATINLAPAP